MHITLFSFITSMCILHCSVSLLKIIEQLLCAKKLLLESPVHGKLWRTETRWTSMGGRSGLDRAAVRPMAAMRVHLLLLPLLLLVALANGQRRRPPQVRMGVRNKNGCFSSFQYLTVNAGGRRLWPRQSVVRAAPRGPRWAT